MPKLFSMRLFRINGLGENCSQPIDYYGSYTYPLLSVGVSHENWRISALILSYLSYKSYSYLSYKSYKSYKPYNTNGVKSPIERVFRVVKERLRRVLDAGCQGDTNPPAHSPVVTGTKGKRNEKKHLRKTKAT